MNMTFTLQKAVFCLAFLLIASCLSTGCAFLQLKEETKTLSKSTVLVGVVSSTTPYHDMHVVVAAYSKKNNARTIVHYTTLHEPGPYELMVPNGTHNIVAFGDKNRNLIYDEEEPAGQILNAEQVSVPAGGVAGYLDIVISEQNAKGIDLPDGFTMPPKEYKNFHSSCPGAIANLDDLMFSEEYGKKGFWAPMEFFKEFSGNIYFLEEYNPAKIPILFVHGASGSPHDWRTFFDSIDRDKYQPWFFYYPSGASIDSMSYLLFWKLQNLQIKYKYKELYITAHSMGGLVVRSFIVNYGHLFPSITNFISISTPWGGEELAELGVKYSPAVIPAWIDMQPESKFFKSIYRKRMSHLVDHYLFFGHKGNRNILRPNNDEVVTLASQLDQRSQRDAKMIYGFNEDHVSILSSKRVISQYNAILADIDQSKDAMGKITGNRLHVDFSFDFPADQPRPLSALLLRPVNKKSAETWLYLNPEDTGRDYGPFPPGNYEVSMIAPAFVPEPVRVPITIAEGRVPSVEFSMKPTGYLRGYIVKNDPGYFQAGESRQHNTEVEIQSITLKGNGIERILSPLQEEVGGDSEQYPSPTDSTYSEQYLSGTDYTVNGQFFFFDLPGGEYELTINAKGYRSYSQVCNVSPGQYKNTIVIALVKELADSP